MQIGGEDIQNLLVNMMLEEKKNLKKTQTKKNIFPYIKMS
jgi:hypothetical protein